MDKVKAYLENLLNPNDTCVLALSGGPDSMFLFAALQSLSIPIHLIVAHVNHNTRPENEMEKEFIEHICADKNIPFEYYKIDKYRNDTFSEQEAREKRYAFLQEVCQKNNAKYLFTAHHGDDLVETILMRIIRGSTLEGYAGIKMDSTWNHTRMIRPLLILSKKEILDYVTEHHIPYVVDETNNSDAYLRNRIRHHVTPELEQLDSKYYLKFLKYSETLNNANHILKDIVIHLQDELEINHKINREKFLNLSSELQELYLREYFRRIYDTELYLLTDQHVHLALQAIKEKKKMSLPKEKLLIFNKDCFYIIAKPIKKDYDITCTQETILPDGSEVIALSEYDKKNNYEIHLNSKDIVLPLHLVNRQNGMKMIVKNMKGHKKVNDILINSKVPMEERDTVPIMIDNEGKVLWILGVKKSKYDLEKDENYDIIYKYFKGRKKEYEENKSKCN